MTEATETVDLATQPPGGLDADQARSLLQAACDVTWNCHDAAALAAHAAPHAVMRVVPLDQVAHGPDEIRRLAEARLASFPDWHVEVREAFIAGDRICGQTVVTGTQQGEFLGHPPTGRRMEVEVCCVFRLDGGGQMAEEVIYFDLATMLRQLGLMDGPGVPG